MISPFLPFLWKIQRNCNKDVFLLPVKMIGLSENIIFSFEDQYLWTIIAVFLENCLKVVDLWKKKRQYPYKLIIFRKFELNPDFWITLSPVQPGTELPQKCSSLLWRPYTQHISSLPITINNKYVSLSQSMHWQLELENVVFLFSNET